MLAQLCSQRPGALGFGRPSRRQGLAAQHTPCKHVVPRDHQCQTLPVFSSSTAKPRRTVAARVASEPKPKAQEPEQQEEEEDEEEWGLKELSQAQHIITGMAVPITAAAQHIITVDNFAPELVQELRGVFDERFGDPRRIHPERFMWDYWWCPDARGEVQYNLVRTQAQVYFGEELHEKLVDALLAYGESQLGCRAISTIWMSYYTDGMLQELHCDNPHGPFAFVLSLTPWENREFTGGETMLLKPKVLDYWSTFNASGGSEHCDLVTLVPALFGRLTLFDPRFPHGVREVRGTRDPRKGRLVLHGWFTDPSPFITGGLSPEQVSPVLNEAIQGAIEALGEGDEEDEDEEGVSQAAHPCTGMLSLRVTVCGADGSVKGVDFLADTLVPLPSISVDPAQARARVQAELQAWLEDAKFPASADGSDTHITVPVVFE